MPWKDTSVLDERIRFVALALRRKQSFTNLCAEFGISRPSGYRWLHRYQETGSFTALVDRSHKPESSPNQTPAGIERRVLELRARDGWGAKKLYVKLEEEGIHLSVTTINRILHRNGVMRRKDSHQPALKRFERPYPNQLWQMDFKARYPIQGGHCYPLAILDDHSRFAVGLHTLPSTGALCTHEAVVGTMHRYGVPKAMLMDHGTPWWNSNSGGGITWMSVQLMKQDIRLYFGAFRHPQTQGKVEALNRTIGRAFDHHGRPTTMVDSIRFLEDFVQTYNYDRPHEGIGMQVPVSRYAPSEKAYNPNPRPWDYSSEWSVTRVNSQGSIDYCGRRLFVAKPLAGENVAVLEIDGRLITRFRNTYIREADLETRKTKPFTHPIHDVRYIEF